MGKLSLEVQQQDWFCKNKVRDMKKKPDPNFLVDHNNILRKVVKLKYTIKSTIVVLRKLTSLMIIVPQCQGTPKHQQNGQHDLMLLLMDQHVKRHALAYQQL